MEFHEAANIFPMELETISKLADDIKEKGQIVPIEIFEGKILDGRRRFTACKEAGVVPGMIQVSPADPVSYVISLNLHRRQLTTSEKGMIQAKAMGVYEKRAKERMSEGGKGGSPDPPFVKRARDEAGKVIGVSGSTVERASTVLKHGVPELVKAVEEGRMSVTTAARISKSEPHEKQIEYAEKAENPRKPPIRENELKLHTVVNGKVYDGPRFAGMAIHQLKRIEDQDPKFKESFDSVIDYINQRKEETK